jgi:hypothetical protein
MERCVQWIRSGVIEGPTIASVIPAKQIQEAFRTMQTALHIGKIVIRMPEDHQLLELVAPKPTAVFKRDRSYLLVGGLGGLGRAVATWMAENGAGELIFLSRTARNDPEKLAFVNELRSQECQVHLIPGNVGNMGDVRKAVEMATRPIAGVINMAMVLKVCSIINVTLSMVTTDIDGCVCRTWH